MPDIATLIERETELVSRFVALLNEEQAALTQADPAPLPDIIQRKQALVEQLNRSEEERHRALDLPPPGQARDAMAQWLSQHPEQSAVAVNWKKLLELARQAKTLHDANAHLVDMHLKQTNEALAILTYRAEQSGLYRSNGQTAPSTGSRFVDSA